MSTVDERVVILEFNNAQFETNVKQSVSTLQKLKDSLNLEGSAKGLDELNKSARSFSLNHVADNIQTVADRFSALGIVGDQVLRRLTDKAIDLGKSLITAIPNQIISGGKRRAQNIEQAKFMLEGLLGEAYDWEKIQEDINYAVSGTAYGFDEAASAAGQLAASSVEFGDDMKAALRGISGVAAMTNDEYGTIAQIFTKIAGQGKVMSQELNQLAAHGINAAATLADVFDTTEAEIRDMVKHGEVDFQMFSYAMDGAFGEHAKNANATFQGVLRNVKASLSRMGEQFATPAYDNLRLILVALLPVMKDIEAFIKPISAGFKDLAESVSGAIVPALENLHFWFASIRGLVTEYDFSEVLNPWISVFEGKTAAEIKELGLLKEAEQDFKDYYSELKDYWSDEEQWGKSLFDATLAEKAQNEYFSILKDTVESGEEAATVSFKPYTKSVKEATTFTKAFGKISGKTFKQIGQSAKEVKTNAWATHDMFKSLHPVLSDYEANLGQINTNLAKTFSEVDKVYKEGSKDKLAAEKAEQRSIKKLNSLNKEYENSTKQTYDRISKSTEEYNKQHKLKGNTDVANAMAMGMVAESQKEYAESTKEIIKGEQKESIWQKSRNKAYAAASNIVNGIAKGAAKIFGFDEKSTKLLDKNSAEYKKFIDDYAETVIHGDYGNGEERIKKLNGLANGLWATVQNVVNEKMGSGVRHAVTDEEDAEVLQFVAEQLGINTEQAKVCQSVFDNLTNVLAGFLSVLYFIKDVAVALFTEVIQPFLAFAIPRVLNAILTPLGFIGDRLSKLYASIQEGSITQFFANFADKVRNFWASVKELDGVKTLNKAWSNFKKTMAELVDKVINKVTKGFDDLQKTFHLPDASFFLGILDSIANALSFLVDVLSNAASHLGSFFEPLFNWVTSIPSKIQEFWTSLWGGGEGEEASDGLFSIGAAFETLKNNVDAFIESVAPLKAAKDWIKGIWDGFFGTKEEDPNKKGIPKKIQQEIKDRYNIIDAVDAIKKKVSGVVDAIAPLRAVRDWMKDFWNTIFGTPGEGEDPANYGFGAAFNKLKQQISDFMDGIPILKTIKDWFGSIFNEGLSNSITDIGKAISDFFKALFDKQEEGEGEPLPFGERFIQAAERLKEKIVQIFGASPELGKLLMTGGGLGAGILGIVKLMSSIKGNQNGGGIAGAIFGAAGGGMSKIPAIIGGLLGISAALNMFGVEFKKTTKDGEQNVLFIEFLWDKLLEFVTSAKDKIGASSFFKDILDAIFGTKNDKGDKETKGIIDNLIGTVQNVFDVIQRTIGTLFGNKEGKLGIGNALGLTSSIAGIYLFVLAIKTLGKTLSGMFSVFTGAAGMLGDMKVAMDAYIENARADTFLKIAKALGIFALGLAALAMVPADNLHNVIQEVGGLLIWVGIFVIICKKIDAAARATVAIKGEVTTVAEIVRTFTNAFAAAFRTAATMTGIGLMFVGISIAVGVLVGTITKLASIPDLNGAMDAFKTIMFCLATMLVLAGVASKSGKGIGKDMFAIAGAMIALAVALKVFESVDPNAIAGMAVVILIATGALLGLVAVSKKMKGTSTVGTDFVLISVGLIAFAYACKALQGVEFSYVVAGMFGLALGLAAVCVVAGVGKGGGGGGGSGTIAGVAVALLAIAGAGFIMSKVPWLDIWKGLLFVGGALLMIVGVSALISAKASFTLIQFTNSIKSLGLGLLALALVLPVLGFSFKLFGEIWSSAILEVIAGGAVFVGLLILLSKISTVVSPNLWILGKSLLAIAAALVLIVGTFTDFKGIRSLIGEISGGFMDILSSFTGLGGGFLSLFKGTSKAVKDSGSDYVTAADSYKKALTTVEGLSSSVASTLSTKLQELNDLDGSSYSIGVRDIVTYITGLNLDEEQKDRVIRRTLRAAAMQQQEKYTLTVYNIELELREHGADQAQIDAVFGDLQDTFNKSPGAITAKVFRIHTLIDELNLPKKDQVALETAVDNAIQSTVKFKLTLKNLRAIVNQSTGVDVNGKKLVNSKIDEILSNFSYKTNIDNIEAWIKTSGIDVNNIYGFQIAVKKAIKEKSRLDYNLGKIYALVNDDTVVEANGDDVIAAVNKELAAIYEAAGEGEDVEEVRSKIENVKLRIESLYEEVDWGEGVREQFQTYLDNACAELMESYEGYHASLNDLKIIFDKDPNLGEEQWKAFSALLKGIWSSDPVDIGELWVTCKEAKMSSKDIFSLFNELGVTLSEQNEKDIELSGVRILMDKNEIPEEQQDPIIKQLEKFDELTDEELNDAQAFMDARNKAIAEIAAITGDKKGAVEMVESYLTEKQDLKNAGLGVLEGMIETMVFGTEMEANYFQNKLHTMYGLYGEAFATEMTAFIEEIKTASSLKDEDKEILAKQAGEVIRTQTEGVDEAFREYLDLQAKRRRAENIGTFSLTETGASIGGNTAASKIIGEALKEEKALGQLTLSVADYMDIIDKYNSGEYTWEQFVGSFEDVGIPDEELAEYFFPNDPNKMEFTTEGFHFMEKMINPWLDGTSDARKEALKKYGHYDFSQYIEKYKTEDGYYDLLGLQKGHIPASEKKDYIRDTETVYNMLDAQIETMTEKVREYKQSIGEEAEGPISLSDIFSWFTITNDSKDVEYASLLSEAFREMDRQIIESLLDPDVPLAAGEFEKAYEDAVATALMGIRSYLHKTGFEVKKESEKTMEDIEEAYAILYNPSSHKTAITNNLHGLKDVFDSTNLYGSDATFYDFLKSNVIGFGPTAGLDIDDLLQNAEKPEDIINEVVAKIVEGMTPDENGNSLIDPDALISLYKAFPNIRQYFKDYLKNNKEISEKLGPEFNSDNIDALIQEQINDVEKTYVDAAEKAISKDSGTAEEGKGMIQRLLENNWMTPAEMAKWSKEHKLNFGSLGEAFGVNIEGMDENGIINSISGMFDDTGLNEMFFNNGATGTGYEIDGMVSGLEQNKDKAVDAQVAVVEEMDRATAAYNMSASPSKLYKTHGLNMMTGLKLGIVNNKDKVISAIIEVVELCVAALRDRIPLFKEYGSESSINYGTGIVSHPQYVNLAGATVVRQASDGIKTEMESSNGPEEMGKNFTLGFAKGITNDEAMAEVAAAATAAGKTANENMAGVTQIESPSKVTMGYGRYFSMGFAIGIKQFGSQIESASKDVANTAINALGNPLAAVQNVLDSDLDYDPTIRPVMDISGIQNGVKTINGMMPNTRVGLDFISNSMNRVKTTNEDVVSAITGLSKQMEGVKGGDSYTVNGVTYDDGSNISTAVKSLIHAAKVERRA